MEGKSVILSVVLVSLVLAQLQAEGAKSCCPSSTARDLYNVCRVAGASKSTCASKAGCKMEDSCASGYDYVTLDHSDDHSVNAYCKLGCTSSMCDAITTLQTSVNAGEVVNEAVERCTKACSEFCNKGSNGALKTE